MTSWGEYFEYYLLSSFSMREKVDGDASLRSCAHQHIKATSRRAWSSVSIL